jgi:DNA topoisomerase-6 subunit A
MSETAIQAISKQAAARKIVEVAAGIHADIVKKHKKPSMRFPIRSLANVKYDVKRGTSRS